MNSYEKVYKVVVPMDKLDEAKSYTIGIQKMIYRGPFGGIKGRIIEVENNPFVGIVIFAKTEDGIIFFGQ